MQVQSVTTKLASGIVIFCRVKKSVDIISSYVENMNFSDQLTDEDKLKLLGSRIENIAASRATGASTAASSLAAVAAAASNPESSSTTSSSAISTSFIEAGSASIQDLVLLTGVTSKEQLAVALIKEAVSQADKIYALEKLQLHHEEELKHLKASFDEELEASKATFLCNREESAKLEVKKLQEKFDLETDLLSEKV